MNQQQKCFEQRVEAFKTNRQQILSTEPRMDLETATRLVCDAETSLRSAIIRNDYGAAEQALWSVMLSRAHVSAIEYGHLYRPTKEAA